MTSPPAPAAEDLREPPPPVQHVYLVCGIGLTCVFLAFIVGLVGGAPKRGFEPHSTDGLRVLFSALGMLIVGAGVSMRPAHFAGWFFFALAGLFGYGLGMPAPAGTEWQVVPPRDWVAAIPNSWDSIQILYGFFAFAGCVAIVIVLLPRKVVLTVLTVGIAFHWSGIYSAVTSPPPQPFLGAVWWYGVSSHYLAPVYLTNAYQFYSPEPGASTEIWACIEYLENDTDMKDPDDIEKKKSVQWWSIPARENEGIDPLNLYFYRHLAVTEMFAQRNLNPVPDEEWEGIRKRRMNYRTPDFKHVPYHPVFDERGQYQPPADHTIRQLIPSYARHLANAHQVPGKFVHGIKLYRSLHQMLQLEQIRATKNVQTGEMVRTGAFNPILYVPVFLGEYDRDGKLKDNTDGMLYWVLPILTTSNPVPQNRVVKPEEFNYYYTDYVSQHAGSNRFTGKYLKDEKKERQP